jgi:hypothetical protein
MSAEPSGTRSNTANRSAIDKTAFIARLLSVVIAR